MSTRFALWGGGEAPTAVAVVFIQAVNDFNDLLLDAVAGRGTSATRGARALFEDLLNMAAVVDDEPMGDRYIAHWPVSVETFLAWDPLRKHTKGKRRKAAAHHTKTILRDNAPQVAAALAKYGEAFRRSWHPQSIADRARELGLTDQYEWYRLSSAVVHGAAIGSLGTFWMANGEPLHRVGPAVMPCPYALAAGIDWMGRVIELLPSSMQEHGAILSEAITNIERTWIAGLTRGSARFARVHH